MQLDDSPKPIDSPNRWAMHDADGTRLTVYLTIHETAKFHYREGQYARNKDGKTWRPGQPVPKDWYAMRASPRGSTRKEGKQ